ncbi:hypothetical protein [Nonomuraea typhae]|uniref:hypothetical protein n=1 Tax=Nonomuraea typhae TaxID=2603600 RepID=UPI0012FA64F8|nr:hypothetical protein [Nonomuraea typhae]
MTQKHHPRRILNCAAAVTIGALIVELYVGVLTHRTFLVLLAGAATIVIVIALQCHADRVEAVTREQATTIKKYSLTLDRVLDVGLHGVASAQAEARGFYDSPGVHVSDSPIDVRSDTGPFQMHNGRN